MRANFNKCTQWVLVHEGGFVHHPKDPGGATNRGVTQRVYDGYRRRMGKEQQSVRHITEEEVWQIYRDQYWKPIFGDQLPDGLDYAMYDFAINSGPSRAIKFLQQLLGVTSDGVMGNVTLGAVSAYSDIAMLCEQLCRKRFNWMKTLSTFATFGNGWRRRVLGDTADGVQPGTDHGVIDRSVWMAHGVDDIVAPKKAAPGKAEDKDTSVAQKAKDEFNLDTLGKVLTGVVPGAIGGAATLPEGPMQWAASAIAIIAALLVAFVIIKKLR